VRRYSMQLSEYYKEKQYRKEHYLKYIYK